MNSASERVVSGVCALFCSLLAARNTACVLVVAYCLNWTRWSPCIVRDGVWGGGVAMSPSHLCLLILKFSRPGPESVPLQMSAHWQCGPTLTRVTVEYSYRAGATTVSTPLTNVQILLPVGEPVTSVRLQPAASW